MALGLSLAPIGQSPPPVINNILKKDKRHAREKGEIKITGKASEKIES
jgi:hypothetical protein